MKVEHTAAWEGAGGKVFFGGWIVEVTLDTGQRLQSEEFDRPAPARAFAIQMRCRTMVEHVDVLEVHTGQVIFALGVDYVSRRTGALESLDAIRNVTIERDEHGLPTRMVFG